MTDAEIHDWWPPLGTVVAALRRGDHGPVPDLLVDAVRGGSTATELLGAVGAVLRAHAALRAKLDAPAVAAWDAVMTDVNRAIPGGALRRWPVRRTPRRG